MKSGVVIKAAEAAAKSLTSSGALARAMTADSPWAFGPSILAVEAAFEVLEDHFAVIGEHRARALIGAILR